MKTNFQVLHGIDDLWVCLSKISYQTESLTLKRLFNPDFSNKKNYVYNYIYLINKIACFQKTK